MELKEIAVVSGKPGLFKIVKPAVNGVILEAMDGSSARFVATASTKVSVLGEISVYTESGENISLEEVFRAIHAKHGKTLHVGGKSSDNELRHFFTEVIPEHDKQRVYNSDIKKITVWYGLLITAGFEEKFAKQPEVSNEAGVVTVGKEKKAAKKEVTTQTDEAPKKAKTAKEPKVVAKKETTEEKKTSTAKKAIK